MKNQRRKLVKALALGTGGITAAGLPETWKQPVVKSVILSAHAQTSVPASAPTTTSAPTTVPTSPPPSSPITIGADTQSVAGTCMEPTITEYFSVVFTPNPVVNSSATFEVVNHGISDPGAPLSDNIVFRLSSSSNWVSAYSISNVNTNLGVDLSCASPENSTIPITLPLASGNASLRFDLIRSGVPGSPVVTLTNYSLV